MKKLDNSVTISCNNCGAIRTFDDKDIIIENYCNFDLKNLKEVKFLRKIVYCPFCSKKIIISEKYF